MQIETDRSIYLVASAAIATFLGFLVRYLVRQGDNNKNAPLPPSAPATMMETIKAISGPQAPWFLLKMARETIDKQTGKPAKIYQVPIPLLSPGGIYVVASADLQRQIMNDKRADKPGAIYGKFERPGTPAGIFTRQTKDPLWKVVRKCAAPSFSKAEVDRMNAVCAKHAQHFITERLEKWIERGESFDPSAEMTLLTFSTIMEAGFEYEVTEAEFRQYTKNVNTFLREFGFRQIANPLRRPLGWFFQGYREALRAADENQEFLAKVVKHYRDNPDKSPNNTLIRLLTSDNAAQVNDKHLLSEVGTFIAGGFDTTGYTLATTLVTLAKHPEVAEKVRQEQAKLPDGQPSEYLRCVMKESRRFLSVAAMGATRQYPVSVQLGSYTIPANAILLMPQMVPHRDAAIYHPDPDAFRPERWLESNKPTPEMQESLISFATGPRNCAGQALAMAELESVLPRLLSLYKFTVVEEGELDYFLTLKYHGTRLRAARLDTKT